MRETIECQRLSRFSASVIASPHVKAIVLDVLLQPLHLGLQLAHAGHESLTMARHQAFDATAIGWREANRRLCLRARALDRGQFFRRHGFLVPGSTPKRLRMRCSWAFRSAA